MAFDTHKNFAQSLVATAPSPATSGTSLTVTGGEGTKFATSSNATVYPAGATPSPSNAEIVRITAISTDTFTITRTQEGTSARTIVVGDVIVAGITAKTLTDVEAVVFSGFYGDGSDGNVTITTTVTLTRDMYYDTLTINSPGILKPAGFRIHCKTGLVVGAGGSLNLDGNAASGATAGASVANASATMVAGGTAGATGVVGAGANASNVTSALGGNGGNGGAGTSGSGGNHGSALAIGAQIGSIRSIATAALGTLQGAGTFTALGAGAGGGSGAGDGTNTGGGGGGGGGLVVLNARAVTNSGTISANGGAGGNTSAGNTGGGGGGGGGIVIVNTSTALTGTTPTATGGAAGAKTGTGVAGAAGSAGNVFVNVWS